MEAAESALSGTQTTSAAPPAGTRHRPSWREWLVVLGLALGVAVFLRLFVVQAFRIPTPSMERNLRVGDFVLVSKLHYGPRLPVTLPGDLHLPYLRLPGFTQVGRGDVVVFNFPVEQGPVDRKEHYVKRVVGLPGETLSITDKVPYVHGQPIPLKPGMQQKWLVTGQTDFPVTRLLDRGADQVTTISRDNTRFSFEATEALAAEVARWPETAAVEPYVYTRSASHGLVVFPQGSGFGRDDYGPLYIPARGDTLLLTPETWPTYRDLITRYEHHEALQRLDGAIEVDGVVTDHYVVRQDYYFVMGDNRDSSADSRVWGFVPMDHIVGKAVLIYFSWDETSGKPRWQRLFRGVE
jgi:signal peptidase I